MQQKKLAVQDICNELNGFLKTFSFFSCTANHGYTFLVESLQSQGSAEDDLNTYYQKLFNNDKKIENIALKQFDFSLESFCNYVFKHWLTVNWGRIGFTQAQFQLCLDQLIIYINLLDIKIIYEVLVTPPEHLFYEASWQDFALTSKDRTYLFHLGVSD